ncbi:kinase-like protein [Rhizopogon vinicolor AM-OR11-026]|uniref:Kinase-like protein n=1 Tax=Rhizopogon vinicolor AM-OR11-026 TaxID=1314800 RepID=A0A1B7N5V4_9AGAM|nr:kinase-like protein [Rhizopogon vinicolor AM-OR11-026]
MLDTVTALILNNACLCQAVVQELVQWHKVRHSNVVSVFGIFHHDMTPFLVTPWISGGNLNVFLTQYHQFLSPVDRMSLVSRSLHSFSIVHGSLTGANILIDNGRRACLTDFGLASIRKPIQGSAFLGTSSDAPGAIRWTATELVAKDVERPTIHSDVYSFGSVALQITTGKVPWSEFEDEFDVVVKIGRGLVPLKPEGCHMTESLWAFIQRCWEFVPEDRPTSFNTLDFAEIEFRATLSMYTIKDLIDEADPIIVGCKKFPTVQPSQSASSHTLVSANHSPLIPSSPAPSRVLSPVATCDSRRLSILDQVASVTVPWNNTGSVRPGASASLRKMIRNCANALVSPLNPVFLDQ